MNNMEDVLQHIFNNPKELTLEDIFSVIPPGTLIPALKRQNLHYILNERICIWGRTRLISFINNGLGGINGKFLIA